MGSPYILKQHSVGLMGDTRLMLQNQGFGIFGSSVLASHLDVRGNAGGRNASEGNYVSVMESTPGGKANEGQVKQFRAGQTTGRRETHKGRK